MSIWKKLTTGATVTVRMKRAAGATESVIVVKLLGRTRADGARFESPEWDRVTPGSVTTK